MVSSHTVFVQLVKELKKVTTFQKRSWVLPNSFEVVQDSHYAKLCL